MKQILVICDDKKHAKRLYDQFLRVFSSCVQKTDRGRLEVTIDLGVGIYRNKPVFYKFAGENAIDIYLRGRRDVETMDGHRMEKDLDDWIAIIEKENK